MSFSLVAPVFLIVLADLMAMMMMVPVLPFFAEKFGASPLVIGVLSASFAVCQLAAAPGLGRWSDRIGRRPVLLVSQAGTLLGLLIMAHADSVWLLFVGRMLDGATAGNIPIAQACLADAAPPDKRAKAFGILGAAFGIGLVFGPALSGWLMRFGWSAPFYVAAGFSALSLLATFFLLKPAPVREAAAEAPASYLQLLGRPELRWLFLQFAVFAVAFGFFSQGIGLFLERALRNPDGTAWGVTEVSHFFAASGVIGILIQGFLMGPLTHRFKEYRLVTAAFSFAFAGYVTLTFAREPHWAWAACLLFSIGNSLLRPALTSRVSQKGTAREQGQLLGTTSSLQSLGMIAGPILGGVFLDAGLLAAWGGVLAALVLGGLVLQFKTR